MVFSNEVYRALIAFSRYSVSNTNHVISRGLTVEGGISRSRNQRKYILSPGMLYEPTWTSEVFFFLQIDAQIDAQTVAPLSSSTEGPRG